MVLVTVYVGFPEREGKAEEVERCYPGLKSLDPPTNRHCRVLYVDPAAYREDIIMVAFRSTHVFPSLVRYFESSTYAITTDTIYALTSPIRCTCASYPQPFIRTSYKYICAIDLSDRAADLIPRSYLHAYASSSCLALPPSSIVSRRRSLVRARDATLGCIEGLGRQHSHFHL